MLTQTPGTQLPPAHKNAAGNTSSPAVKLRQKLLAWRVGAVFTAAFALFLTWATWRFFVDTWLGQSIDTLAFEGSKVGRNTLWPLLKPVLEVVSTGFLAAGILTLCGVAVFQRRYSLAFQAVVLIAGANFTTQILKEYLFSRPDFGFPDNWGNSLPSGHTTVAASLAAALVIVAPVKLRPLATVLGVAYAVGTGVSTLVGQWHRVSDVLAAILVVLTWAILVCGLTPLQSLGEKQKPGSDVISKFVAVSLFIVGALAVVSAIVLIFPELPFGDGRYSATQSVREVRAYAWGVSAVFGTTAVGFGFLLALRSRLGKQTQ